MRYVDSPLRDTEAKKETVEHNKSKSVQIHKIKYSGYRYVGNGGSVYIMQLGYKILH